MKLKWKEVTGDEKLRDEKEKIIIFVKKFVD